MEGYGGNGGRWPVAGVWEEMRMAVWKQGSGWRCGVVRISWQPSCSGVCMYQFLIERFNTIVFVYTSRVFVRYNITLKESNTYRQTES